VLPPVPPVPVPAGQLPPTVGPGGKLAPDLARRGIEVRPDEVAWITYTTFNMKDPVVGGYTPERIALLREADDLVARIVRKHGLYDAIWQAFAVLLPVKSVGVMGDERTYEYTVAIRAVESRDGMTADWARLPHDLLARISSRIVNDVKGINRVVYDISSKPPSTIEWE